MRITVHDGECKRTGYEVSGYIAIALIIEEGAWGIFKNTYKKVLGGRAVKFTFQEEQDAFKFAEFLNNHYNAEQELMYIWSDEKWKGYDIFNLCQYTVPNGQAYWMLIDRLNSFGAPLTHQQAQEIMRIVNGHSQPNTK